MASFPANTEKPGYVGRVTTLEKGMDINMGIRDILLRDMSGDYFWALRDKARYCRNRLLRAAYRYRYRRLMHKNGCSIPLSTEFGGRPSFPHGMYGIFISQGAKIGENATLFHHVTIGSNTLEDSRRCGAPIVGNRVYIGAGAKIIGAVTVGDNVRIGANAVVVTDIPPHSTVVLSAPRTIIHKAPRDNTFHQYGAVPTAPV